MKKILMVLAVFIAFAISCNKQETVTTDDCVYEWQTYENAILQVWGNTPVTTQTTPDGKTHTGKYPILTPEVQKLFEQRGAAYKGYLAEIESKGGKIKPLGLDQYCWWCACPNCGWCGNLHYEWSIPWDICSGLACQRCYYFPLNTCWAPVIEGACAWDL